MAALTTAVVTGSLASAITGCSDKESSKASSSEKVKLRAVLTDDEAKKVIEFIKSANQ